MTPLPTSDRALNAKSERQLLTTLFRLLEQTGVRYCVLHSYDTLPEYVRSDVDMAVHPDDIHLLSKVILGVRDSGYLPVQCLNYAVGSYYFVFAWQEELETRTLALDVTCEHRRAGAILMGGQALVAGRRRFREFWVASAEVEFTYVLAKRILKGQVSEVQSENARGLIGELGTAKAEECVAGLLGESVKSSVVQMWLDGSIAEHLGALRRRLWFSLLLRRPWNPVWCALTDIPRIIRRWFNPTGLFIAVLGPDGVGKSTMIGKLTEHLKSAFRSHRLFHWRPMLIRMGPRHKPVDNPHARPPLPAWWSVLRIFGHLVDYHLGYRVVIRRLLAHSCLVIFDRYSQDSHIDPARFRYGGPDWLARAVCRLVPQPDLLIVLDAPEDVILARTQETSRESIISKRAAYRGLASGPVHVALVDASRSQDHVAADASAEVLAFMAERFKRVHQRWSA